MRYKTEIETRPISALRNEWYTPPEIFRALGVHFDLDPASPPGGIPWIPVAKHYSYFDNGLEQSWDGCVWLNPPYGGETGKWMQRLAEHGDGIGLVFARTDTEWWQAAAAAASAIVFIKQRVRFLPMLGLPTGDARSPNAPSCLLAYGYAGAASASSPRPCRLWGRDRPSSQRDPGRLAQSRGGSAETHCRGRGSQAGGSVARGGHRESRRPERSGLRRLTAE